MNVHMWFGVILILSVGAQVCVCEKQKEETFWSLVFKYFYQIATFLCTMLGIIVGTMQLTMWMLDWWYGRRLRCLCSWRRERKEEEYVEVWKVYGMV